MRPCLFLALALAGAPVPSLAGQGLAGSAVEGVVWDSGGQPVTGALVVLRHTGTGAEYRATTSARGRFALDLLPPGGPYSLEVRIVGRAPTRIAPLQLDLGDRLFRRVVIAPQEATTLADLTVQVPPVAGDGGPGYLIPAEAIHTLPLSNRNFVGLFATVPQAIGRDPWSISGQNPAFNAIQIDGGTGSDLYGVGRTPGVAAGAKSISLEALAGLRVLIAPFDVRQGGFSGGLLNAVTRSGTNRFESTIFTSFQRPFIVGDDTAGNPIDRFDRTQYGFTVGGPIRRDVLHFFVAVDIQRSATPFVGPEAGAPGTGISDSTASSAASVFRSVYGFDAGTPAPPVIEQPDQSIFAKLTWRAGSAHLLELSHNRVDAEDGVFGREVRDRPNRDGWALSRSGGRQAAAVRTTRLHVTSTGRRWQNELLAGYQTTAEDRASTLGVPLFLVQGDVPGNYLAGGSVVNAQGTILDQQLLELADHITWTGGRHQVTAGMQAQLMHFTDNLFINSWGVWRFPSVDALTRRQADRYEANLPLRQGGPIADFHAQYFALYLQDQWSLSDRATLTGGLRFEAPFMDAPYRNPTLYESDALGRIDTGDFPTGNTLLAPRIGLKYDLAGDWSTVLRAGVGMFTGRPPFAWLGGAFSNTGLDQRTLICTPQDGVPPPVTDPALRPDRCLFDSERPTPPASVVAFSPEFRFPQTLKFLAGVDHAFGSDITASLDLVHVRTLNAPYLQDVNLVPGAANGEGRIMYGEVSINGTGIPNRADTRFLQVLYHDNTSNDHFTAMTVSLGKTWGRGGFAALGYQWSHTEDRYSINRISANLTFQATPVDGSLAERNLARARYDAPHTLTMSAAIPMPADFVVAFLARHQSGLPYAWTVGGDPNADGVRSNDLFYVPRSSTDISLADPSQFPALDAFIEDEACLRSQRGRIMARNSCRNPSITTLDARISWTAHVAANRFELAADIFNLPNLLNDDWGLVRETSPGEARPGLVLVTGWDESAHRPVYILPDVNGTIELPPRRTVLTDLSRWRIQLGLRAMF